MLPLERADLAETDAVLARARPSARQGVVDDVAHELLRGGDAVGGELHGDVEVAVTGVAEDPGFET